MLFDELVDFVAGMMARYSLAVELERFYPAGSHTVLAAADLAGEIARFGHVDRVWLLCKPRTRKPERFMLNVGRVRGKRLEQAQLGGGTEKREAFAVLKKLAADLKRATTAGVWVVNQTGTVGYAKTFRISPGAAAAARAGTVTLTAPGATQRFFPDPPAGHVTDGPEKNVRGRCE
jgi:hypothetical protein